MNGRRNKNIFISHQHNDVDKIEDFKNLVLRPILTLAIVHWLPVNHE